MTVLITGAGLIGCHTAALLAARGQRPVLLDLHPAPQAIASLLPEGAAIIESADVRDRAAMLALMQRHKVEAVVHTAAALSLAIRATPVLAADVNLLGTVNLLEAARTLGLRRFVFASSASVMFSVFRRLQTAPIKEDFVLHAVSERPATLYAASKLAGEFFVQQYAEQFGLSCVVLRYSAVLGLWGGPNNSIPGKLMARLLGEGAVGGRVAITDPLMLWAGGEDFIDARDVAAANIAALDAPSLSSPVFNIASGRMASYTDFSAAARQVRPDLRQEPVTLPNTGFSGFPYPRDQPFDVSLARAELGWAVQHDLVSSLREARAFVTG